MRDKNDRPTDRQLEELARTALERRRQERDRVDDRWDRLSAGELSTAEVEELEKLARESEEGRLLYESFRPLDREFRQRMVGVARAGLAAGQAEAAAPEASPTSPPIARRSPLSWLSGNTRLAWAGAAAAVVGIALVARALLPTPAGVVAALPAYEVELAGVVQPMRGPTSPADTPEARFASGGRLELVLRPAEPVDGGLAARLYRREAGQLIGVAAPIEISPQGSVRLAGRLGEEIDLPAGRSSLVIVVGRPDSLPRPPMIERALGGDVSAGADGWTARRLEIVVTPPE